MAGGKEWKGENSRGKEESFEGHGHVHLWGFHRCTRMSKCSKLHISNMWSSVHFTYNLTKAKGQGHPGPGSHRLGRLVGQASWAQEASVHHPEPQLPRRCQVNVTAEPVEDNQ